MDLAGSERLKETGNTSRDAVRETGCINKSLFTLGQVLASLSAKSGGNVGRGMQPRAFVPYRDSKLTQLLWEGLRGTGRALMLACLGPTKTFAEESLNTLHFASMALRIKAAPVVLIDPQVGGMFGEASGTSGSGYAKLSYGAARLHFWRDHAERTFGFRLISGQIGD